MRKLAVILIVICLESCIPHCLNRYSGQVVDSKTKLPIKNVRIVMVVDDDVYVNDPHDEDIITDSLGRFNIEIMTGSCWDNVKLIFTKDDYSPSVSEKLTNNISIVNISMKKAK
jgi:hypothetical protein